MKKSKPQKTSTEKKSAVKQKVADDLSGKPDLPEEFLVVGIGASAGGIQALKEFFENVPADSGVAFVVILHLSPDHDSRLAEVLQQSAQVPVTQVKKRERVAPNHVYVVPPNEHLEMFDGYIVVSTNTSVEDRRAPIDIFFRTLAESHRARAVAVVLSGTGANGSMGIKRIKERGGAAFVQNPREAEFSEMPRNSIATDLVDRILNVAEIPAHIIGYKESLGTVEIPVEAESRPEEQQQALREIFTQLRMRTGHDFSNYKRATVLRRIERRINVRQLEDLPAYAAYVRENTDEATALLKDLLISVTNFFRDREAFHFLESDVLPKIFHGKRAEDTVRIWVAGCATGEEAYSLAMLCCEQTDGAIDAPAVQIFASDIDQQAIATARDGFYTLNDAADVSPERMRRFFTKENEGYRVRRDLREMVLFANHNVLKDPAFSHLDAVTCRNMLIYLNHTAQERVMETFHFALEPGGFLLLGNSETVDGARDLYATVSKEHHIYQSRHVSGRIAYPIADLTSRAVRFDKTNYAQTLAPAAQQQKESETLAIERASYGDLHLRLLEQYTPSVLVNEQFDIVHISGSAARFLQMKAGEPTQNILKLIMPELRLELRTALFQAAERQTNVEVKNLKIAASERDETINIYVRPVAQASDDTARGFVLILFETAREGSGENRQAGYNSAEPIAGQLEEELVRSQSQLRRTVEQFEAKAEELKASNEELQAMKEEMRSAAKELETSKEELQSVNEELITVNQELKVKIEEVSQTSSDFHNLINSTDVATIFLDRSFRIQTFTPAANRIFNLIPADYGRPLADITHRLEENGLIGDAKTVLKNLQTIERETRTHDGRTYLLRILPYRTAEDRIGGVVATFLDISERKRAETALRESEEQKRLIIESAKDYAIFTLDLQRRVSSWNAGAEAMMGYAEQEILGNLGDIIFTPEDRENGAPEREAETALREDVAVNERFHQRKDGSRFWGSGLTRLLRDEAGTAVGFVNVMRDLTEQKRAEEAKFFLASIVESSEDSIVSINLGGIITSWNNGAEWLYGYPANEAIGKPLTMLTLPEDLKQVLSNIERIKFSRTVEVYDTVRTHKDGHEINLEIVLSPVKDDKEEVIGASTIARDVTERKRREANLAFLAETSADFAPLLGAEEIMERVGSRLAEYLNLSRCNFAIVDEAADRIENIYAWRRDETLPDSSGAQRISTFLNEAGKQHYSAGKLAVINDVRNNPLLIPANEMFDELGVRSIVDAPYLKDGRWKFLLTVARAEVSEWRADEIQLIQELAERIHIRIERAYAEESLRESEGRFRVMFEQANVGIVQIDLDGHLRIPNPGFCEIIGYNAEECRGLTVRDITHPDDYEPEEKLTRQLIKGKIPGFSIEKRYVRKDGSIVWGQMTTTVVRHQSDEPLYALAIVEDITERKRVEENLRESETRLRLATEAGRLGAWEWNLVTDEVFWNEQHFILFGMEPRPNPLRSEEFFSHVRQDDRERVGEELQQAIREKNLFETDFHAVLETGETRWMSGYGRVVEETSDGEPLKMSGLMFDITERKRAEQAVRESEIRYRAIVGQSTAGITELDLDGYHVFANPGYCETLGYTKAELLILTLRDITHPDDYPHCAEIFKDCIENGCAHVNEKRIIRKDGAAVWITDSISLITDAKGNALRVATIAIDITHRRRAEEALAESEERLRLLIESASDYAIFTTTPDNLIDSWNTGAEKVFGWSETEVLGKSGEIIFTPEDRAKGAPEQEIETALRTGRAPDERFHIRRDGSRFYASGVMTLLKTDGGAVQGFVKIARDMTEQLEAEKTVREKELLQKLVGAQEDERKRIARDLHDELGQQLTALRLKLAAAKKMCDDELCGKIDEIELIAKSIDNGVDFLAWELRPAALDDLGLIAALENYVKQWSHHSGVTAELLGSKLKSARFAPEVETNLYRIVQEALNNVHKHARAKSVEIVVERRDGLIVLVIEDDGKGFNLKDKKNKNKGMGLIGMRERAQLIKGEIEIESAPKKGTTIYVRVPAERVKGKKSDDE